MEDFILSGFPNLYALDIHLKHAGERPDNFPFLGLHKRMTGMMNISYFAIRSYTVSRGGGIQGTVQMPCRYRTMRWNIALARGARYISMGYGFSRCTPSAKWTLTALRMEGKITWDVCSACPLSIMMETLAIELGPRGTLL